LKSAYCTVHSTRGGGANGYLAACMTDAMYALRAGQAFDVPAHPGQQPVHAPNATSAQITATNCLYDQDLHDFSTYLSVTESICTQILDAVTATY
jgi:hypothetical protein